MLVGGGCAGASPSSELRVTRICLLRFKCALADARGKPYYSQGIF